MRAIAPDFLFSHKAIALLSEFPIYIAIAVGGKIPGLGQMLQVARILLGKAIFKAQSTIFY